MVVVECFIRAFMTKVAAKIWNHFVSIYPIKHPFIDAIYYKSMTEAMWCRLLFQRFRYRKLLPIAIKTRFDSAAGYWLIDAKAWKDPWDIRGCCFYEVNVFPNNIYSVMREIYKPILLTFRTNYCDRTSIEVNIFAFQQSSF